MAIYPAAVRKLIPPGSNDPRITPRVVVLHVAVSRGDSLWDYFAHHSGGIESHFYVRDDGTIEQYRDTDWQADANYQANDFAVSIETEGMGAGKWTPAQLASIEALLTWCHATHRIPLEPIARWDGSGVGYHSQFRQWSPVAKSCPGPERIAQYHDLLVPWMAEPTTEEDDMASPEDIAHAVWAYQIGAAAEPAELVLRRARDRAVQAATKDIGAAVHRAVAGLNLDVDEGRLAAEIIKQLATKEDA